MGKNTFIFFLDLTPLFWNRFTFFYLFFFIRFFCRPNLQTNQQTTALWPSTVTCRRTLKIQSFNPTLFLKIYIKIFYTSSFTSALLHCQTDLLTHSPKKLSQLTEKLFAHSLVNLLLIVHYVWSRFGRWDFGAIKSRFGELFSGHFLWSIVVHGTYHSQL